jgi:hypothetical protein
VHEDVNIVKIIHPCVHNAKEDIFWIRLITIAGVLDI